MEKLKLVKCAVCGELPEIVKIPTGDSGGGKAHRWEVRCGCGAKTKLCERKTDALARWEAEQLWAEAWRQEVRRRAQEEQRERKKEALFRDGARRASKEGTTGIKSVKELIPPDAREQDLRDAFLSAVEKPGMEDIRRMRGLAEHTGGEKTKQLRVKNLGAKSMLELLGKLGIFLTQFGE